MASNQSSIFQLYRDHKTKIEAKKQVLQQLLSDPNSKSSLSEFDETKQIIKNANDASL